MMRFCYAIMCISSIAVAIILSKPSLAMTVENSIWVETVGEALGSEYDPPKEVMERAKNEAKRKAIDEAVGSFIKSHTLVSKGMLTEEFTFARVRGKIQNVKILAEERDRDNPNLFRVKLRAKVRPVYPQDGEGIQIKLDLFKKILKEGEEVKILYQTNADCYVYIFSIAADNSVTLLFPNSMQEDNFVKANRGVSFPPADSPIRLQAMLLSGDSMKTAEEKVKIIATRQPEIILHGFQEGMFKVYDARSTGLTGDLARKLNQLDPADWGEAVAVYVIEKR